MVSFYELINKRPGEKTEEETILLDQTRSTILNPECLTAKKSVLNAETSVISTSKQKLIALETLKQFLEKLTKKYNSTCSINKKIRNEINSFRKERTLYDHVFKNLESLILQEETKLMKMLKKNNEISVLIKTSYENLTNIMEMEQRFKSENFLEVLKEEQAIYNTSLEKANNLSRKNMKINLQENQTQEEEIMSKQIDRLITVELIKPFPRKSSRFHDSTTTEHHKTMAEDEQIGLANLNESRVALIEKLVKEFNYKTEENKIDSLILSANQSDRLIEQNYVVLSEMEDEVKSLEPRIRSRIPKDKENKTKRGFQRNQCNITS